MGRSKEFDHELALEKAMFLFWKVGYENTSLKDLLKEMDIFNGSFYNTYGNKKNLFIEALRYYEKDFTHKREELFKLDMDFKKKIRLMLSHVCDRQQESVCPKGCFLFNSVSADVLRDLDIFKFVFNGVNNFQEFLEREIKNAIDRNEIEIHIDPKLTASILTFYVQGMMKLSILNYNDVKFRIQTDYFLKALGL